MTGGNRASRFGLLALTCFLTLFSPCAFAQSIREHRTEPQAPNQSDAHGVRAYLRDTTRVESWSFFEPFPDGGDPTYTIFGHRATLGVRVTAPRFDLDGAYQYSQLLNLPPQSIGPGALGAGALYFFSAEARESYQLYFKRMCVRLKQVFPHISITAGRMAFSSGEESPSGSVAIDELKHLRVGSRLIGDFDWSIFQRSFDGVRFDVERRAWAANASLLFPTQGGYEESANPTMSSVKMLAGSFTAKPSVLPHQSLQAFIYHYRDQRPVRARPDNAAIDASLRSADISIVTVGVSEVALVPTGAGDVDAVVWVAGQTGDWYGQPHRAISVAAEGGLRLSSRARPWIRAGILHASGDRDAQDGHHGTFFQLMPDVGRYSLSTAYSYMNIRDTFVQVFFQPRARVHARVELHRLSLANATDRWYSGSGATSSKGTYFGFSGRSSGGSTELGTVVEGSADVSLRKHWSMNAYVGWMKGDDVVKGLFAGDRLVLAYVENVLAF